jgi:hypothetical protein
VHAAEVRASVLPYTPEGQGTHTPTPPTLYVPGVQADGVGEVDPAGHAYPAVHGPLQAGDATFDALPYRPGPHRLQVDAPDRLNVPGLQDEAVAVVEPAGHA